MIMASAFRRNAGDNPLEHSGSVAWHALEENAVLEKLSSSPIGLSRKEALKRILEFGPNLLPAKAPPTLAFVFFRQFLSPLIYVLLAACAVAVLIGDAKDAGFIFGVVLLDAAFGTYQEWKAERSAAGLQRLIKIVVRAKRDGKDQVLPAEELVPGDVVQLEPGNRVPADLRLLRTENLKIDESLLTGESQAVEKHTRTLSPSAMMNERSNIAFAGSIVIFGRGTGVVVATGSRTEVGKIAWAVTATEAAKPPLVIRMERFARRICVFVLLACALLAVVALAKGLPIIEVFFLAVALAVSAIPEGLPVAITVALSIATNRMTRRNVIVRKLTAVEALGSCTYIASDKTGTLTLNKQSVESVWLTSGELLRRQTHGGKLATIVAKRNLSPVSSQTAMRLTATAMIGAICNDASPSRRNGQWQFSGDAVDVALWELASTMGIDPESLQQDISVVGNIAYESERGYAARFFRSNGGVKVAVKGAPEIILARCDKMAGANGHLPLDRPRVEHELSALSASGHRVLAIAEGFISNLVGGRAADETDLTGLTLLALVGLIDPARPQAKAAVLRCQQAGIQVGMVTGDHPMTALAIAREVGIADSLAQVLTGRELADIGNPDVPEFLERVQVARVFARVTPMQKFQIVDALVKLGHFVAVTGDGVNDAPALKRANIGVAMGSGTDVAKETASIIIADDNFASLEAGVEEGRFAYDNIRKVTYLLISTGGAEIVLFLLALISGMPIPLLPVQILWLNLVTNGIQDVALAFEGGEPESVLAPPRKPTEGIFDALMIEQTVLAGLAIGLISYFAWRVLIHVTKFNGPEARNVLLLLMVLLENVHVFNCRSERVSALKIPLNRNWLLVGGVFVAQSIHILAMHTPLMQSLLQVQPLSVGKYALLFALASSILAIMEIFKCVRAAYQSRYICPVSH
jgi:magnesium-transporting ATPase (P-type)